MKFLIMLITSAAFTQSLSASELSCEQTVSIAVSQMLHNENSDEVLRNVGVVNQTEFTSLLLYWAHSSTSNEGIPYASHWLVLARRGPQQTCTVESITLDERFQ